MADRTIQTIGITKSNFNAVVILPCTLPVILSDTPVHISDETFTERTVS